MKYFPSLLLLLAFSCQQKPKPTATAPVLRPTVSADGNRITMPNARVARDFGTQTTRAEAIRTDVEAPGHVAAMVVKSFENPAEHLVLFDTPELSTNYSNVLQHRINIKTQQGNLARVQDLAAHGAASGKDVIDAQTALANEQAGIIEDEARLKLAGFDPEALYRARPNTVWVVCEVPENQLQNIRRGMGCTLTFASFANERVRGSVADVNDFVDPTTRQIKIRIAVANPGGRLKAGMFATVQFGLTEGRFLTVPREAVVTVQGRDYVFVRRDSLTFERRAVQLGQERGERVVAFAGIRNGEAVVSANTLQLKGLSFGY